MRKHELDVILMSNYCDIVLEILKDHKELGVFKTMCFSYLIKKEKYSNLDNYKSSTKKDIVFKSLSHLSGQYADFTRNFEFIFKAIHLLIVNNKIIEDSGELIYNGDEIKPAKKKTFIFKAIEESKNFSDRQFLKEVLSYV